MPAQWIQNWVQRGFRWWWDDESIPALDTWLFPAEIYELMKRMSLQVNVKPVVSIVQQANMHSDAAEHLLAYAWIARNVTIPRLRLAVVEHNQGSVLHAQPAAVVKSTSDVEGELLEHARCLNQTTQIWLKRSVQSSYGWRSWSHAFTG
jgi:hypothetical protein